MKVLFNLLLTISLAFGVLGANVRISRNNNKEFACPPDDGFYPADDQCTGTYYYCAGGNAYAQECPCSGDECTVFDPELGACVDPASASCNPSGGGSTGTAPPPATGTASTPPSGSNTTSGSGTSATTAASVATPASSLPPFTCPGDGFYPVPGTCGPDFYICAGDIVGSGTCPQGALFDPVTYKCEPEAQTTCNMPFDCPAAEGFFPYPGGCSAVYYICIDGVGYIQYCPGSTIFDPILLACVREPSCRPGDLSTTESTIGPTTEPTTTQFVCPADGNYGIAGECKNYYICAGGVAFVGTCPGELVFNTASAICDYPENVPECAPTQTTVVNKFY